MTDVAFKASPRQSDGFGSSSSHHLVAVDCEPKSGLVAVWGCLVAVHCEPKSDGKCLVAVWWRLVAVNCEPNSGGKCLVAVWCTAL